MKKTIKLFLLVLGFAVTFACSKSDEKGYEGINKIYLSTTDDAVIIENEDKTITVNIDLTTAAKEDLSLNFEILDNSNEVICLEQNPVTIKAGSKTGSFIVKSNKKEILNTETYFEVSISNFPTTNMALNEALKIKVKPNPAIPQLTEDQKNFIAGYKTKMGIDLNKVIGLIPYKLTIKYPGKGNLTPFINEYTKEFEGKTLITLSENATAEKPLLKMIDNPLGLTEYLYKILRQETIEDNEFNCPGESPKTNFECMLAAINCSKTSEEKFSMTLNDIEIVPNTKPNAINFTADIEDSYGDVSIVGIPFNYSFSAWDRLKKLIDNGGSIRIESGEGGNPQDVLASDLALYGITLKPKVFLFYSTIDSDEWANEPSDWIEPKASVDFTTGKMTFQFSMDHYSAGGYTQVKIEYSFLK